MADNLTSRGVKRDFVFDNLSLAERLTSPSIDTNNSTSTRSILPAGNLGTTTQTLPIVAPVRNLVYSDGKNWVPLAPQSAPLALVTEAGYIGLGFTSSQPIPPNTETIVALNNSYGALFPPHPSFTEDITGPNYGFMIDIGGTGLYQINYQLKLTANSLTVGGDQTTYQSSIRYFGIGTQRIIGDLTYGPFTIGGTNGVVLQGMGIVHLLAGTSVVLVVQHNSAAAEDVIGPITGLFLGSPQDHQSYFQIKRLDSPLV